MKSQKPSWLKIKGSASESRMRTAELLAGLSLNTVCHEAACPNVGECFNRKTATFMILGIYCTRNCRYCNVLGGDPQAIDVSEPERVAEAVKRLNLKHVVITSVTRDDLSDGGAGQFAATIKAIRHRSPATAIEVLIPDLQMKPASLDTVIEAGPDIIGHNMETVAEFYPVIRPEAIYERSLAVLRYVKEKAPHILTKSGIMLGVGEERGQVEQVLRDLREQDCDFLTIGQYLAPTKEHHPVVAYITPEEFEALKDIGYGLGFTHVAAGPLVRSSYHADEAMENHDKRRRANGNTSNHAKTRAIG